MIEYHLFLSLFILAVLLIRTIFRKTISPRAIYALWLVVVIRMLLPITLFEVDVALPTFMQSRQTEESEQLPEGLETTANEQLHSPSTDPSQTVPTSPSQNPSEITPVYPSATPGSEANIPMIPGETAPEIPNDSVSVNWKRIADLVWLIGAVITATWVTVTSITYNRRIYKDRRLHRTVRGTKVYVSESAGVPCIAGLIPSVYITPEAANCKSERLIILHECIHLRHGDHIWSIVRALALIVFWWNPLIWVAATVSKQDAELACDDAVAAKLDDDERLKYASILLDTIPQKNRYAVGLGSAPMKERILMLTKKQKNRWICLIFAILLTVSAVGCSFASLEEKEKDETSSGVENGSSDYGQGPFIGYVADKESPWIQLYTEKNGTLVGSIPYGIFWDWPATDRESEAWEPGWDQEYLCYYYDEFGDFRWAAVHLRNTVLGVGRKNVATSTDGGETWSFGSSGDHYGGNHVVGMGFASDKIAFMSFDPYKESDGADGPVISRTVDGGKTWALMEITVPDSLKGKKLISGSPFYDGDLLRYPVWLEASYGEKEGEPMYLISRDRGLTWEWETSTLPVDMQ